MWRLLDEAPQVQAPRFELGAVQVAQANGAASRALLKDSQTGGEITVNLPQTGEFGDLREGDALSLSWTRAKAKCFRAEG